MQRWTSFGSRLALLRANKLISPRFPAAVSNIDKYLPQLIPMLRTEAKRSGGITSPELLRLLNEFKAGNDTIYGKDYFAQLSKTIGLTLGSNDIAQTSTFRIFTKADIDKMSAAIAAGTLPTEAIKSIKTLTLAEAVVAILRGEVHAVFVNGSGNNLEAALRNGGLVSAMRPDSPLSVLLHYNPLDAPRDWPSNSLLQLSELAIADHAVIAAAASIRGEDGRPPVATIATSAGAIVPSTGSRCIGDPTAKANLFVIYANPALPPALYSEMMVPKIGQPDRQFHISAIDGLGFLAMIASLATQPWVLAPRPDVIVPKFGHGLGAALSYFSGKLAAGVDAFGAVLSDLASQATQVVGLVRPDDNSPMTTIAFDKPSAPGEPVDPDEGFTLVEDGGATVLDAAREQVGQSEPSDLEDLPDRDETEEDDTGGEDPNRDPEDPDDPRR